MSEWKVSDEERALLNRLRALDPTTDRIFELRDQLDEARALLKALVQESARLSQLLPGEAFELNDRIDEARRWLAGEENDA